MLKPFVSEGRRVRKAETPDQARERAGRGLDSLPEEILAIDRAKRDYAVELSNALRDHRDQVKADVERMAGNGD